MKDRALGGTGSKKRVNSKVKGNRNEVEAAKALSEWTGVEFRRTPASGAIHIPRSFVSGDVFCAVEDHKFPFTVETKHYNRLTDGLRLRFWRQATEDANRLSKQPMLLMRENGMPARVWEVWLHESITPMVLRVAPYPFILNPVVPAIMSMSPELFNIPYNEFIEYLRS